MSDPIRVGVIGLGMMGTMHLGAYQKVPGARVAAICARDPKRAAGDFSDAWSNLGDGGLKQLDMTHTRGTTDYREVLAMDEVDVVDVCVPTPQHADIAIAALEAGKHVICEKPLARTSADAQRIADAAARAQGFFMPAMCMRFWPQWQWLKEAVADGRYGRVLSASFFRMASMPPGWFSDGEASGGALLDLHIHDTDFVCHLFGKPDAVFSRGYSRTTGCTDHVATQYLYEGDGRPALVTAAGGWCMAEGFPFTMRYLVNFERATAIYDLAADPALRVAHEGEQEPIPMDGDGYRGELEYFLACVRAGRPPKTVTVQDAVTSIRIAEAEQKSIETRQVQPV